jgi:hypothetical protein
MTAISLKKTADQSNAAAQDGKLTLSGYGFTIEINGADKPLILDAEGNAVIDVNQRMAAQENLILPLIETLGKSWQQELAGLQQATAKITMMSTALQTAFTAPANDNTMKNDQIGYVTQAGLVYAGIGEKDQFLYTTKTNLGVMTWYNAEDQIKDINKKGEYKKDYGDARFATGWNSKKNELYNNFYLNKDAIGGFVTDSSSAARRVWGPESYYGIAQYQRFDDGSNSSGNKSAEAALRPVWSLNHLVI